MDPIVSLQGRTIVVTGAGQGIGKGIVELAIELGANVVAVDLNGQTLDAAVSPLPQARVLAVQGSVADPAVADRAVTEAVAKFGAVHGLVNNAGIIRPAMIDKMTDQQWQEVIDVHLTGSFYWMRATGRHMVERSKGGERTGGSIVNISSDAGRKGSIGQINGSTTLAKKLSSETKSNASTGFEALNNAISAIELISKSSAEISDMVKVIYRETDPRLHGAAALSVLAHLIKLAREGRVTALPDPTLDAAYSLAVRP